MSDLPPPAPREIAALLRQAEAALNAKDTDTALRLLGQCRQAEPTPSDRRLALEARAATMAGRPDLALAAWTARRAAFGLKRPEEVRFALALAEAGDLRAGLALLHTLQDDGVTVHGAASAAATLHHRLMHWPAEYNSLERAVATAATPAQQRNARLRRARCLKQLGNPIGALADFLHLDHGWPEDPAGILGQIDLLLAERHVEAMQALLAAAEARFPGHVTLLRQQAQLLHEIGEEADLLAFCRRIAAAPYEAEAIGRAVGALVSVRKVFASDAALADIAACFEGHAAAQSVAAALRRPASLAHDLAIAQARLDRDVPHSLGWLEHLGERARLLVRLGDDAAAEADIGTLRGATADWPYPPPVFASLFEWLDVRQGEVARAQRSWRARRILRDRSAELVCRRRPAGPTPPVTVFCHLRNERPLIEPFLAHYRRLGVERFVLVDNASDDGTTEFLEQQPDIELFWTCAGFRRARQGNEWMNPLIARPEHADSLCLRVDADEHVVFAGYETSSLPRLWRFMQREGSEAIAGHFLDLFPERLSDLARPGSDLRDCRYFDPGVQPRPLLECPYTGYGGGVRSRLLEGKTQTLHKVSGIRGGGDISYLMASHTCSPARLSSLRIAILHYKFYPNFLAKVERIVQERQYAAASQEYVRYASFADRAAERLPTPESVIFEGSATLLAQSICNTSQAWEDFNDSRG
jgi:hypothetical protein